MGIIPEFRKIYALECFVIFKRSGNTRDLVSPLTAVCGFRLYSALVFLSGAFEMRVQFTLFTSRRDSYIPCLESEMMFFNTSPSFLLLLSLVVRMDMVPVSSSFRRKDILESFLRIAANINKITFLRQLRICQRKQSETAVSAGLVKIGENLKETKKNKTLNEFAVNRKAVNRTQFYGIFEEILLQA